MKWAPEKIIGFDLETSGDKPEFALQPWRVKQGAAWITSLVWTINGETHGGLDPSAADLHAMLQYAIDNDCTIVGWNVSFDIGWLLAYGLEDLVFKCKWLDGMLLWKHATIEPEYAALAGKRKSYGLKACVAELLPQHAGYEDGVDFHTEDPEELKRLHEYNVRDVEFTLHCSRHWFVKLNEKQRNAALIEAECLPMIAQANYEGLTVDMDGVRKLQADLEATAADRLAQLTPHGVTEEIIRSPAKLATLLFETWALDPIKNTDSGARSTDKETLHELSLIDDRVKLLREYREALNNKAKFADTPAESVAYNGDGRTHPEARIFGTYSGRLTYSSDQVVYRNEETKKGTTRRRKTQCQTGFAIHQMKRGKEFRSIIAAPKGYTILEFDAAGQEFRWMSILARDPVMMDLCQPGGDAHKYMGDRINPHAEDKKAARQLGKVANLSLQYRTSAKKLRVVARTQYLMPMEIDEATKIRDTYLQAYRKVPQYWDSQIKKAMRNNYVETLAGRRVNLVGDWQGEYEWSMESTSINYPVQGIGADQKYLALKTIKPIVRRLHGRLYLDLHDGIYLLIPDEHVTEALHAIKKALDALPYQKAWGFTPPIPMPWDAKVGNSWGGLQEFKFEEVGGEGAATKPLEPLSSTTACAGQGGDPTKQEILEEASDVVVAEHKGREATDQCRPNKQALIAALKLADAGIKVFPCRADKRPVSGFMRWEQEASNDPDTLRAWFGVDYAHEAAMVGVPCGPNGLVAIDPDTPKPEKRKYANGVEAFSQLIAANEIDLAGVPVVETPSGGRHYIFAQPQEYNIHCSRGDLPESIDVKGVGGYIIGVGSVRDDGLAYKPFVGASSLIEAYRSGTIPIIPAELQNIIGSKRPKLVTVDGEIVVAERMSIELLTSVLKEIENDAYFEPYDRWVEMAHAIKGASQGSDHGKELWLDWCSTVDQTDGEPERVWDSIKSPRMGAGYIRKEIERRGLVDLFEAAQHERAQGMFDDGDDEDAPPKPEKKRHIVPTPFVWKDPATIPRREWLYGRQYIRAFVSTTVAPGGTGKSSLVLVEAIAMATGRRLLHDDVKKPMRVWYWNGEDPREELDRRIFAILLHFGLDKDEEAMELLSRNFCYDSGRDMPIRIAETVKEGTRIAKPLVKELQNVLRDGCYDVLILDPFVVTHSVAENDNPAISAVIDVWKFQIASMCGVSVELVHHVRKTNGAHVTIEDGRGAVSLRDAVRSGRALNPMDRETASQAGIRREARWAYVGEDAGDGKANMAPKSGGVKWYHLAGLILPNGSFDESGDDVGVVEPWIFEVAENEITGGQIDAIKEAIGDDQPRYHFNAKNKEAWVGRLIADAIGRDIEDKEDKKYVTQLIDKLIEQGHIVKSKQKNTRQGRQTVVVSLEFPHGNEMCEA